MTCALRWASLKQSSGKSLATDVDIKRISILSFTHLFLQDLHVQIFKEVNRRWSTKAQFFLGIIGSPLLPFNLASAQGVTIYNPQQVMRQFGYDKGVVTLTGELSTSSALVPEQDLLVIV